MTEPVDVETLRRLERDVGTDVVRQLIEMFLDSGPQRVRELHRQVEAADRKAAAATLHSLKSSAGNLGAYRFGELAERVEHEARTQPEADLAARLAAIDEALAECCGLLERKRDELGQRADQVE